MTELQTDSRWWFQKKRYLIPAGVLGAALLFGGGSEPTPETEVYYVAPSREASKPAQQAPTSTQVSEVETESAVKDTDYVPVAERPNNPPSSEEKY